jgi:hypothetical protein
MNRLSTRFLPALALAPAVLWAPLRACDDQIDHRAQESAYMAVLGTAQFHVARMNVPARLVTAGSYDGFWDTAIANMVDAYQHGGQTQQGQDWNSFQGYVSDFTGDTGFAASIEAFMIGNVFAGFVSTLQSLNMQHRDYEFLVPAAGQYRIVAHLTGDFDKPRNRVVLNGPGGSIQLDDDNPSSDRDKAYVVNLTPGTYSLSMLLGTGWSATFHNAGTLTSVTLDNPTPVDWAGEIVLAAGSTPILANASVPGVAFTATLPYRVPTTTDFTNVLAGSVSVTNIRTLTQPRQPNFVVTWTSDDPYELCVTLCSLAFQQAPVLGPNAATYFFLRGDDVVRSQWVHSGIRTKTLD